MRERLRKPIVIVGMMGVGKTHIGRKLAEKTGLEFFDSDKEVEKRAGCTIAEIFEEYGEEKFRQSEHNAIAEILNGPPCVLATGGGAVLDADTRKTIKDRAISVWLKAEIPEILVRLGNTTDRPLLKNADPEKILAGLMEKRGKFYAEADIHIECQGAAGDKTLEKIINSLCETLEKARV